MNIRLRLLFTSVTLAITLFMGVAIQAKVTASDITGGAKAPHVNVAAFHILHGIKGFEYPARIEGDDILSALRGKAQYIFMNHTSGLKDGDVVTVANDVIRSDTKGLEDFGVDCHFFVKVEGKDLSLAGLCKFLFVDQDHREISHKGVIKPLDMKPEHAWTLLYDDKEDGIAIYAETDFGLE